MHNYFIYCNEKPKTMPVQLFDKKEVLPTEENLKKY